MSLRVSRAVVICAAFFVATAVLAASGAADDPKYAWNLGDLYPTEAAWVAAKDGAIADLPKLAACRGRLPPLHPSRRLAGRPRPWDGPGLRPR